MQSRQNVSVAFSGTNKSNRNGFFSRSVSFRGCLEFYVIHNCFHLKSLWLFLQTLELCIIPVCLPFSFFVHFRKYPRTCSRFQKNKQFSEEQYTDLSFLSNYFKTTYFRKSFIHKSIENEVSNLWKLSATA